MVDNVFPPPSILIDQQGNRNPPPPVTSYKLPIAYFSEDAPPIVHEQGGGGGGGGANLATEQWFPGDQNQDQLTHHHFGQRRTKTNKYYMLNGDAQRWGEYNSEHQTLGMPQEPQQLLQQNPGSSPLPLNERTCDNRWGGGLMGSGENCFPPATGWGDDMTSSSSSLPDNSSSSIMNSNSNTSPENPKQQENNALQSAVFIGSETIRQKHEGEVVVAKRVEIGKGDESLYDRYCHHRDNSDDKENGANINIHHSVDEERAASVLAPAAYHQRAVSGVNIKNDYYYPSSKMTVTQETVMPSSHVEMPQPHQPCCDVNDEEKSSSFHYGSSSVISNNERRSNSLTPPTDNWPEWGCKHVPQTTTMREGGGKQQHDHDDITLFSSSSAMNNTVSEPGVVGSAGRPLRHWEHGSGGGGGPSSIIGQGWGDADDDDAFSQVSAASEALTGTAEQPTLVEGRRMDQGEHNASPAPPCGNDSSEGSWDFGETLLCRITDHSSAAQLKKREMRCDESSCIIGEEELLPPSSHILRKGDVDSLMKSRNSRRTNLVPRELPEGVRVPDIEGKMMSLRTFRSS